MNKKLKSFCIHDKLYSIFITLQGKMKWIQPDADRTYESTMKEFGEQVCYTSPDGMTWSVVSEMSTWKNTLLRIRGVG